MDPTDGSFGFQYIYPRQANIVGSPFESIANNLLAGFLSRDNRNQDRRGKLTQVFSKSVFFVSFSLTLKIYSYCI